MAPIVNPNVLSGYLNISLCVLFAQALAPRAHLPRPVVTALIASLIATQLWISSRGGMLGLVAGLAAVLWLNRRNERSEGAPRAWLVLALSVIPAVAAILVFASTAEIWDELWSADVSKLQTIRQSFRIVPSFPIFGIGRGAFESVFPAFRTEKSLISYTHPENVVAQWMVEWGVPIAACSITTLAYALRPSTLQVRAQRAIGAWAALASLALQNLVDFGSEFPGVVVSLCTCAAIVTGGSRVPSNHPAGFSLWGHPRLIAIGSILWVAACAAPVWADRG